MKKQDSSILFLILLVAAGVFGALYLLWPESQTGGRVDGKRVSATTPQAQALVNKHLWIVSQQQEFAEKKRELENVFQSPQIGDSIWPVVENRRNFDGIDHSPDRNEQQAFKDLNRYPKEFQMNNPDQVIQGQLADEQKLEAYKREYQAEYARQFIENARRNGYQVELDDNYVVIRVTPIPGGVSRESLPQAQ